MEINRKSHVADPVLLEFTGKEIVYLETDLVKFTAYDKDLNQAKYDALKTLYHSAMTFDNDTIEIGTVKGYTESFTNEFNNYVIIFKDVRYFARKAFGNTPSILTKFGLETYKNSRKTQLGMIAFMHQIASVALKFKAQLIDAGMKESVIDSIEPATEALENANITQETGKKGRSSKADERVLLINSIYDILLEFSEAAKIIFVNDPFNRSKYILPYSTGINGGTPPAQ